jgi:hypothetical protein
MGRKLLVVAAFLLGGLISYAQDIDKIINAREVERIERVLAADDMQGRAPNTPGIEKAAQFIASEFKKAGIKPVNGDSYMQEFNILRLNMESAKGTIDGREVEPINISVISTDPEVKMDQNAGFEKIKAGGRDNLYEILGPLVDAGKKIFLVVDSANRTQFNSLKRYRQNTFPHKATIVAVLTNSDPTTYSFEYKQKVTNLVYKNVVGILPGKSKKEELVIFSAHYDHLGIRKPNAEGDSIYNGANDDASGTTAVIMLANYFAKKKDNERTLIFAAFTAEESGGYGSRYFSQQYDPAKVMAMFNIEMIGTESKWGTNSAFITGYDKTDFGKILEKNLEGTNFKFYPDPYPQQNLFFRSDNATLARLGVPAHTISTSKMDVEKYYHTPDDEVETLDMKNMAEIIKAIAISSATIVAGKDTPTRVDVEQLGVRQ